MPILDNIKRNISRHFAERKTKKVNYLEELGLSAKKSLSGYIPDIDYNNNWNYPDNITKVEEMIATCPIISRGLEDRKSAIISAKGFINPYKSPSSDEVDKRDVEISDFIREALEEKLEIPLSILKRQVLTGLEYGHSVFEIVLKQDNNKYYLKKLSFRPQNTINNKWKLVDGSFGITQKDDETGKELEIPYEKLVIFTFGTSQSGQPVGQSVLRSAYFPWFLWQSFWKFNSTKQERFSNGIPQADITRSASKDEIEMARQEVMNLRNTSQTAVINTENKKITLMDMGGKLGTPDLLDSIKLLEEEIAIALDAERVLLAGKSGSYAMREDMRSEALLKDQSIARYIDSVINEKIIKFLVDLNFSDVKGYPYYETEKLGDIDYEQLASTYKIAIEGGFLTPNYELEEYFRYLLGLGEIDKEEWEKYQSNRQKIKEAIASYPISQDKDKKETNSKPKPKGNRDDIDAPNDNDNPDFTERFYQETLGRDITNKQIRELYATATEEEIASLKKKGFYLNTYEDKSVRPLLFTERKVDFQSIEDFFNEYNAKVSDELKALSVSQKEIVLKTIKDAVLSNNFKSIQNLKLDKKLRDRMIETLNKMSLKGFKFGIQSLIKELESFKLEKPSIIPEEIFVMQSRAMTDKFLSALENSIKLTSSQIIAKAGGITAIPASQVVSQLIAQIDTLINKNIQALPTLAIEGSVNFGRDLTASLNADILVSETWSAILDRNTCNKCLSLDGRTEQLGKLPATPLHFACRCLKVYTHKDELYPPKITGIPKNLPVNTNINDYEDIKAPMLKKGSPAIKVIKNQISQRKEKLAKLEKDSKYPNQQKAHREAIARLEKVIQNK